MLECDTFFDKDFTMFGFDLFKRAPVTLIIFWMNIFTMSVAMYLSHSLNVSSDVLIYMGALRHNDYSPHLVSSIFLHAGIFHILMNMMTLLFLGKKLEPFIGSNRFIIFYMLCGVVGSLFATTFNHSHAAVVGASGAILGLIAADLVIQIRLKTYKSERGRKEFKALLIDLVIISAVSSLPFVSAGAHIGGFLCGFIMTWLIPMNKLLNTPRQEVKTQVIQENNT